MKLDTDWGVSSVFQNKFREFYVAHEENILSLFFSKFSFHH